MEELENLEETLNDSIRESLGARSGIRSRGKKGGGMEDDEEVLRYVPKDKCGARMGEGSVRIPLLKDNNNSNKMIDRNRGSTL